MGEDTIPILCKLQRLSSTFGWFFSCPLVTYIGQYSFEFFRRGVPSAALQSSPLSCLITNSDVSSHISLPDSSCVCCQFRETTRLCLGLLSWTHLLPFSLSCSLCFCHTDFFLSNLPQDLCICFPLSLGCSFSRSFDSLQFSDKIFKFSFYFLRKVSIVILLAMSDNSNILRICESVLVFCWFSLIWCYFLLISDYLWEMSL